MKEVHFAWPSLTQLHVNERQRLVYDAARRAELLQAFLYSWPNNCYGNVIKVGR